MRLIDLLMFCGLFYLQFFYKMIGKQNRLPNKQGVMYELNLEKSQGPYLSKDIMHSNPKSITLLAGSQIIRSFTSLNQTLKLTQTKQREYNLTLSSIQNFVALIKNLEEEINRNIKNDSKLKVEEVKLRNQLYALNDSVIQSNNNLAQQYLPLLKGLHKVVREQSSLQKQQTFRMQREVRGMVQAKKQILQGIFKCEQKIIAIEACFGIRSTESTLDLS